MLSLCCKRGAQKTFPSINQSPPRFTTPISLCLSNTIVSEPVFRSFELFNFFLEMNGPNVLEDVGVELARTKAENRRMARWLRAKKLSVKRRKKELRRIKRVNQLLIAANKRMQELVDDFLLTAEANNNHVRQMNEAIQGMNDLNLDGNYNITTVNQVQPRCNSGSATDGDNNNYNRGGEGGNSRGYGGGHDGGRHE
ncbi:hypothetical protein QQP08_016110 [Theobroma cacao]|nr:hypothetical protein QQP08_016110 [Theobroma cacao]